MKCLTCKREFTPTVIGPYAIATCDLCRWLPPDALETELRYHLRQRTPLCDADRDYADDCIFRGGRAPDLPPVGPF